MIESAAYDLIKQEGIQQGIEQGELQAVRDMLVDTLEARFDVVPGSLLQAIRQVSELSILKQLHKKAATVESIQVFKEVLQRILND